MDLALDNLQWLICHKTNPNHLFCHLQILRLPKNFSRRSAKNVCEKRLAIETS